MIVEGLEYWLNPAIIGATKRLDYEKTSSTIICRSAKHFPSGR
jgi:hypothetical protein